MNNNTNNILINDKIELDKSNIIINKRMLNEGELLKKLQRHKSVFQVLKSYNKNNENKYIDYHILAIDKNIKSGKFYICFKHITDKIAFIESWKFGNLYEIITNDIVKPYFDIDYKIGKFKTDDEVKIIIKEFLKEFNSYFRLNATNNILYCYGKRCKETNKWKSIHIVIDTFKITKTANKDFVDGINKKRTGFKKIVGSLDGKVYTHNRLFSLPYQNKMGGKEFFEWFYSCEDDYKKYAIKDITFKYLINDVKKCVFNDYHDNPTEYKDIVEKKIIKLEIKQTKIKKTIDDNELINLHPQNIVDKLLEHLPIEFYEDVMWNNLSRQIYLNKFNGYEKWLEESAKKSKNYTHEQNINWGNKLNDKYISNNINKYLTTINEHFNCCFMWSLFNYFNDESYNWICERTQTKKTELKEIVMKYKAEQDKKRKNINDLNVGNNYIYNMKKQTLINHLTKSIYHYGLDNGFDNQYGVDISKFKPITQAEIIDEMIKFLKSINRLSGWKMLWGSGKTHYGVATIIKYAIENGLRVLFITENNNLNIEMTAKFDGVNHLADSEELDNLDNASLVISSMESLNKVLYKNKKTPFEIILFDEYESIINHLLSTGTFASTSTTPYEVSVEIKELINVADKIICLDCDLSEARMDLITNIFIENNDDEKPQLFNCSHNSWTDYTYNIYRQKAKMMSELNINVFDNNKRIIYATTSKADASTIFEMMWRKSQRDNISKNIMIVSSEGVEYYVNDELYNIKNVKSLKDDLKKLQQSKNYSIKKLQQLKKQIEIGCYASSNKAKLFCKLEQVLKELNIEVFIYTPSIKCGISFGNSETEILFDILYGYATNGSITAREFLQMLHRCRHLLDKEINFYVKNDLTSTSRLIKSDVIENLIEKNNQLKFNDDKWWKENVDMEKYAIDDFYKQITITNFKEMIDSERNYSQEILGKLKYNHNLNVIINNVFENDEEIISTKEEYDDIKKHQEIIKHALYQYENMITKDEYKIMRAEKSNNENYLKTEKYKTINKLHINKSSNKLLQDERNKDIIKQELLKKWREDIHALELGGHKTSGNYQNYTTNAENETFFYDEENEMCDEIIRTEYDLNKKIQYSAWLMNTYYDVNIGKKTHIKNLMRLNNEIISDYKYDVDRTQSDFVKYDIEINKLKLTKSIMDILEIDRINLIYKRKIISNKFFKNLLNENSKFIITQLIYFVNKLDTTSVDKEKLEIKKYSSSNKIHYKYVKSLIVKFLSSVGIQTRHLNRSGGAEKNNYEDDKCLLVIQYELYNECEFTIERTFINTYYDTIKNDIYYYQFNTQRLLNETIDKETLDKNISNKTRKKQIEKKFHTYRSAIYKKNRYITYKIGEAERSIKIPFNLLSADFINDKQDNIIDLKKKTDDERIMIYLKIELDFPNINPTYKMNDMKSNKNDTRFYEYKDVRWKQTENNFYIKEQVDKYTTNNKKKDNVIIDKLKTDEDNVNDALNEIINTIVFKDDFKNMLNENIQLGGEQELIAKRIECLRDDDMVNEYPINNSNDAHMWVHRPNIYIK